MERTLSTSLYQLSYREVRTYFVAALFVLGNIVLPQLCHLVPQGGLILLPIYFFTLIGAYKYGFTVGLLTAVCSPLVNHALFGMPAAPMLAPILEKSVLLAAAAAFVARRCQSVSLVAIALVVVLYQSVGMLAEWIMSGSWAVAVQDLRLGFPGILLQVFGGWAVLRYLMRR